MIYLLYEQTFILYHRYRQIVRLKKVPLLSMETIQPSIPLNIQQIFLRKVGIF